MIKQAFGLHSVYACMCAAVCAWNSWASQQTVSCFSGPNPPGRQIFNTGPFSRSLDCVKRLFFNAFAASFQLGKGLYSKKQQHNSVRRQTRAPKVQPLRFIHPIVTGVQLSTVKSFSMSEFPPRRMAAVISVTLHMWQGETACLQISYVLFHSYLSRLSKKLLMTTIL